MYSAIASKFQQRGSFESAEKWFNGILDAIRSLGDFPLGCPVAEESEELGRGVRLLLHGKRRRAYKVYYAVNVESESVRVFHVRHWARRGPSVDEMEELVAEFRGEDDEE
jgi:plasmid stabilization system protein ParE